MDRQCTAWTRALEGALDDKEMALKEALTWLRGVCGELTTLEPALETTFAMAGLPMGQVTDSPSLRDLTSSYIRNQHQLSGDAPNDLAARLGMECSVFIPDNLEAGKVLGSAIFGPTIIAVAGNYDDVNRLCTQVADRYGWGFVNINLRAYYAEGAKTLGFEVVEQLGWRYPDHLVSPVAGGTLLPRIAKGFREMRQVGLVAGRLPRIHAAQAAGCAPVVRALESGADHPDPVRPNTLAKSIAIGNPADGYQVLQTVRDTGGAGTAVTDEQIVDAIQLLAETEGIFTEPAGGTTLAGTIDLIQRGVIGRDESVVVCVTGNGYKTAEVVSDRLAAPVRLSRAFKDFEAWWEQKRVLA